MFARARLLGAARAPVQQMRSPKVLAAQRTMRTAIAILEQLWIASALRRSRASVFGGGGWSRNPRWSSRLVVEAAQAANQRVLRRQERVLRRGLAALAGLPSTSGAQSRETALAQRPPSFAHGTSSVASLFKAAGAAEAISRKSSEVGSCDRSVTGATG
jgi:hypothetical protein